jgi:micrococcal nuclease
MDWACKFWCMKYIHTILLSIIIATATPAQLVVQVHDADTYTLLVNGKLQIVRLENVDAPELKQHYGTNARDSVRKLIEGKTVAATFGKNDLYGRKLASISINGQSLDSILVCHGYAWHYKQYSHKLELSICEAAAKAKCIGLWLCPEPVPPWVWRKLNAKNKRFYGMCH